MSTQKIRGAAGIALAVLGLLVGRSGSALAEAAAAPGCLDNDACRAVNSVSGFVGPGGPWTTSSTASCEGPCNGIQQCQESSWTNSDGSRTFQCTCDPAASPAACSGFATIAANGECTNFTCMGSCDPPPPPPGGCKKKPYDIVTGEGCPAPTSGKIKCVCE